jgi:hypothetical protein
MRKNTEPQPVYSILSVKYTLNIGGGHWSHWIGERKS